MTVKLKSLFGCLMIICFVGCSTVLPKRPVRRLLPIKPIKVVKSVKVKKVRIDYKTRQMKCINNFLEKDVEFSKVVEACLEIYKRR